MKKLMSLLSLAVLLTGCIYQTVDKTDLLKAEHFCKDKGGVMKIASAFIGSERIYCLRGGTSYTSAVKLPSLVAEKVKP